MESENIDDTKNSNMNLPVNVNLSSPVLRYFSKKKFKKLSKLVRNSQGCMYF